MALKYQHEIEGLNLKDLCPTETIPPLGVEVFRWSYDPINHPNNFLPNVAFDRAVNLPYNYERKDNSIKCRRCASSFFTNISSAIKRWENLSEQNKENFGYTHIASGVLDDKDGIINKPDESTGHFGFYEYDSADLTKKFKNVLDLKYAGS